MKERMEKHQNDLEEEKLKRRGSSSSKSEPEQLKNSLKVLRHSDSDDDKQKRFKNTRKDGEEKYETMIYSISTSSGKFPLHASLLHWTRFIKSIEIQCRRTDSKF